MDVLMYAWAAAIVAVSVVCVLLAVDARRQRKACDDILKRYAKACARRDIAEAELCEKFDAESA